MRRRLKFFNSGQTGVLPQLVGDPSYSANQNWNIGFFDDGPTDAAVVDAFGPPDPRAGTAAMWIDFGPTVDILHRPDVGSYLVRDVPVPEPSSGSLLLTTVVGVVGVEGGARPRVTK